MGFEIVLLKSDWCQRWSLGCLYSAPAVTGLGIAELDVLEARDSKSRGRRSRGLVFLVHVFPDQMSRTALGVIRYLVATSAAVLAVLCFFILKIQVASINVSLGLSRTGWW